MICGQVPTELEIIRRRIAVARSIAGSFDAASAAFDAFVECIGRVCHMHCLWSRRSW